ncbi:MAG: hypothetical protein FWF05_05520 [Oscillospiraceae bacterium]|nr:hypothetical protein [Oscillospiraceae bacterium]
MKKYCLCIVLIALFLVSCQANQATHPSTPPMETNATDVHPESSSVIIWVEGDGNRFFDENGTRRIAVNYKEINLSEMTWNDQTWDNLWPGIEPLSDLTWILDQRIAARDDAARIATEVMASEQEAGNRAFIDAIGLSQVAYDPKKSIWVISYWQDRPGSDLSIALDGNTGELIRIWAYGE